MLKKLCKQKIFIRAVCILIICIIGINIVSVPINSKTYRNIKTLQGKAEKVSSVSFSGQTKAAIMANGDLYCWGRNMYGQVGNGSREKQTKPVKVLSNIASISFSDYGTAAAVTTDGDLYCWGYNEYGQVGNGSTKDQLVPVKILSNIMSVSFTTSWSVAALTTNGDLYCWGRNMYGQVGNGSTKDQLVPVKVLDNVAFVSNSTIEHNTIAAITKNKDLYCWGYNECGQVGNGSTENQSTPVKVLDDVTFVSVFESGLEDVNETIAAIKTNGDLYCWGYNEYGQVGNGFTDDQLIPVKILNDVTAFNKYYGTVAAITTDGDLYCWGYNKYGQVGNGSTENQNTPVKVLSDVISVSSSEFTTIAAITTNGDLYCWGDNGCGQIGNGSTEKQTTPVKVLNDVAFVSVFGNYQDAFYSDSVAAITTNGDLYCWGSNEFGQIGNNSTKDQNVPVKVLSNIASIDCSEVDYGAVSAITTDGDLYCWGYNECGQIGNSSTENQKLPVKVLPFSLTDDNIVDFSVDSYASGELENTIVFSGLLKLPEDKEISSDVIDSEINNIVWTSSDYSIAEVTECEWDYSLDKNLVTLKVSVTPYKDGLVIISGKTSNDIMVNCIIRIGANTLKEPSYDEDTDTVIWDSVYFGEYPQNLIACETDNELIRYLAVSSTKYEEVEDDIWSEITNAVYNDKNDCTVNGIKYHREKSFKFGYYYYKYSPIKWRVLSLDNNILLFSDICLDTKAFNETKCESTWKNCTLRSWLNGYDSSYNIDGINYSDSNFIDCAFNTDEQSQIQTVNLDNSGVSYQIHYGNEDTKMEKTLDSENTDDKIFLLSLSEITSEKYGFCLMNDGLKINCRISNKSSFCQNGYSHDDCYWLRSSGHSYESASIVYNDGYIEHYGWAVDSIEKIRPAICINKEYMSKIVYAEPVICKNAFYNNPEPTETPSTSPSAIPPTETPTVSPSVAPIVTPSPVPSNSPTPKPSGGSSGSGITSGGGGFSGGGAATVPSTTITPSPSPSAVPVTTVTPIQTQAPVITPEITPIPLVTPGPEQTPEAILIPSASPVVKEDNNTSSSSRLRKGSKITDKNTKAVYKIISIGKDKTVQYDGSTKKNSANVVIPASVKLKGKTFKVVSVENGVFKNNNKLKSVKIGKNIKTIGEGTFSGCKKLADVKMGKNIISIKANAFSKCPSLTFITIPSKVKKIGEKAFYQCKNLRYIDVKTKKLEPGNIGGNAFGNGYGSPRVKSDKSVWKQYQDMFTSKGLSNKAVFIINPAKLVI